MGKCHVNTNQKKVTGLCKYQKRCAIFKNLKLILWPAFGLAWRMCRRGSKRIHILLFLCVVFHKRQVKLSGRAVHTLSILMDSLSDCSVNYYSRISELSCCICCVVYFSFQSVLFMEFGVLVSGEYTFIIFYLPNISTFIINKCFFVSCNIPCQKICFVWY